MSDYKLKEKFILYTSLGRLTGLTDVKVQLWDPDNGRVVTDGVMTEEGSTGRYYYSYTPQKTGTYYGSVDTVTKPYYRGIEFVVVDKLRTTGGGRCFYDGPEFTEAEKAALLASVGAPLKAMKELKKIDDVMARIQKAIGEKVEEQLGVVTGEIIAAMQKEIRTNNQQSMKKIQMVGDKIIEKTNRVNQTITKSMDALEKKQELTESLILDNSDPKALAKVLDEAEKRK